MCFGTDARPPLPPIRGGSGHHGEATLRSADGTEFRVFYAHPDGPSDAGVVILPDVRGLHPFYEELAERFAEAGLHTIAIDYFGRTAGTGRRDDDFPFRDHASQVRPEQVDEDVAAAVARLRHMHSGSVRSVFTVGFCFGGAMSWRQSAAGHGLAGCVGFYGRPERASAVVDSMRAPLLLLAAGQDRTPVSDVETFAAQVRAAGVEAELHVYPDAPHSFFDRSYEQYTEECDDAWRRILDFVARHRAA
jgi:carboxymethylenebutenolidase